MELEICAEKIIVNDVQARKKRKITGARSKKKQYCEPG
jgi:hypothetical protein